MDTPVATLTVEAALTQLQETFKGEFFRVTINEVAEIDELGSVHWREKYTSIMRLSQGLDGFYTAPTLKEAVEKCRTWHAEQQRSKSDGYRNWTEAYVGRKALR